MKNLWNRRVLTALVCTLCASFFISGCEDDFPTKSPKEVFSQVTSDIQRKIDFIRSTGFEEDTIIYIDGIFYVDGDIMINEKEVNARIKHQKGTESGRTEQRRWQYLVDGNKVENIKVAFLILDEYEPYNCSGYQCHEYQYYVGNEWQTAFENAIAV